jgi:hypothetical protein
MRDIAHLLRTSHLQQLANILKDPEASDNDRFVALDLLKNASIAAGGVLPMCQDTGTAIVKAKKNPHSRAIICTARADFDDKHMFLQTFRDHGLPIDDMHVERAGNLAIDSSAEAKKVIFRRYINTKNYTKLRLYDDAMSNLTAFLDLEDEYPHVKFEAYFVKPDGSTKVIKR